MAITVLLQFSVRAETESRDLTADHKDEEATDIMTIGYIVQIS